MKSSDEYLLVQLQMSDPINRVTINTNSAPWHVAKNTIEEAQMFTDTNGYYWSKGRLAPVLHPSDQILVHQAGKNKGDPRIITESFAESISSLKGDYEIHHGNGRGLIFTSKEFKAGVFCESPTCQGQEDFVNMVVNRVIIDKIIETHVLRVLVAPDEHDFNLDDIIKPEVLPEVSEIVLYAASELIDDICGNLRNIFMNPILCANSISGVDVFIYPDHRILMYEVMHAHGTPLPPTIWEKKE